MQSQLYILYNKIPSNQIYTNLTRSLVFLTDAANPAIPRSDRQHALVEKDKYIYRVTVTYLFIMRDREGGGSSNSAILHNEGTEKGF